MKKVLSIILSITMLLSITAGLNLSAYAATDGENVEKIEYIPAKPIVYEEYTNGFWTHDYDTGEKYFYYYTPPISNNDTLIIYYKDGNVEKYTFLNNEEIRNFECIKGNVFLYYNYPDNTSDELRLECEKKDHVEWKAGKNYIVFSYYNASVSVPVVIQCQNHSWNSGIITKKSTCTSTGEKTYTCTVCEAKKTQTIAKSKTHTYKTYTSRATIKKNGSAVTKCKVCGKVKSKSTIYYPKTIKLSKTSYTYNGKVQTPSVTVKDSKGKTLKKNTDYTVTYAKGRKNVGKYAVKITFKRKYSGSKTLYYTIKPKSTSLSKLTAGKKKFTVKWKKLTTQTTGYQIQYSTSLKFKSAKTVTVSKNKTTSKTISKLKAKNKYYVRIRTYKTVGKTKYYSSWSKAKAVITKK